MHEFELGVWKKVFIHLLRILECVDGAIIKLDRRFRNVPTFGRDSIRRFTNSVSELKKLGARDYENILQEKTCSAYETRELKREMESRVRRTASKSNTTSGDAVGVEATASKAAKVAARHRKTLNLNTYKDHALGDYVESIRRNGTMELDHRSPKSRYLRTSRKNFEKQLGSIERRQARIRRIRQRLNKSGRIQETLLHEKGPESPTSDYHIGKTQNHPLDLGVIARETSHDPAAKNFTKHLQEHLLPRIHTRLEIMEEIVGSLATSAVKGAQNSVLIKDNRIYEHKLARFYHTTYVVRRSEDVINPRTSHCNIMLLSDLKPGDASCLDSTATHPYLYGRVIGIYHVNAVYIGPGKRYSDGIGLSCMSRDGNDWKYYYVNRFADRDMTMRYHWGLGIGHTYSHGRDNRTQQYLEAFTVQDPEDVEAEDPSNNFTQSGAGVETRRGNDENEQVGDRELQDSEPEDQDVDFDDTDSSASSANGDWDKCNDSDGNEA
ncbi:hypothetical protein BDZ97DRAFT_1763402 [Flammula alnicola]|nr:hypothetical protein BDZ97DRAFT_1763402 [Flammula alnicola]